MAIARLAETFGVANLAAGNYDTSISAPASTPNGVCVVVLQDGTASDLVTSVQYGTTVGTLVPLTERRFVPKVTEPGAVYLYWAAGVTFPSGAQVGRIVRTGTNRIRAAWCPMTCTPITHQIAVDIDVATAVGSTANPSWAHTTQAAPTECYLGIHSGITTMTNTPAANWTLIGFEDAGAAGYGVARRTMATAGNAAPGWTIAADDWIGTSVSFKEVPLTAPATRPPQVISQYRGRW